MKKLILTLFLPLIIILLALPNELKARNVRDSLHTANVIIFSENKGQWDPNVLFRAQLLGNTLFLEKENFTFLVQHPENANLQHLHGIKGPNRYRTHAYKMFFKGANTESVTGKEQLSGYENYFIGRDHSRWASQVHQYHIVSYKNLYQDIDMQVYSLANTLKYDFIVHPHANPKQIVMEYQGIEGIKITDGNLIVHTSVLDIIEMKPYAYQIVNEEEEEIPIEYRLDNNVISFKIGSYNHDLPLIIDPHLYFSTYTGSTADNWGTTGAYDSYKNTYTAGIVFAAGYPTSLGAYDGSYNGNADIGIFKFDTSGSQRLYATYLGGFQADMPHSIFINSFDELVIFGTTGSNDFPVTPSAYDTSFNGGTYIEYESYEIPFPNGSDIFISRFSSDGTQLMASTYVGGSGNDGLNFRHSYNNSNTILMLGNDSLYFNYGDGARGELITDDLNNIYVGSTTFSYDFPTTSNTFQPLTNGGQEGIVFKIDYNLSNLLWASYIGGHKDDAVYSIDVDKDYNLLICGGTNSIDFPTTPNAYHTYYNGGSADGFVAKIDYTGRQLMHATTFGSNAYDQCYFVRCGKKDEVFIFGQTKASGSTLIYNANYNTPNSGQFVARFSPALDTLRWSTVFGTGNGEPNLSPTAFMADICNRIYLAGWGRKFCGYNLGGVIPWNSTGTWNMTTTPDAYQSTTDGQDFYVMTLASDASQLIYGTFFGELHTNGSYGGNDHVDGGTSRFDKTGTLYQSVCASCGGTGNFPVTSQAWSTNNLSTNCNNAIFRLNLNSDYPVAEFVVPAASCAPYNVHFHNTGRGTSYLWDFGDGSTSTLENPSHTYTVAGSYTVTLIANMISGCKEADTMQRVVTVLGNKSYRLDTLYSCPNMPIQIGSHPMLGCTYQWVGPNNGNLSDSTIANPYTSQSGDYTLLISSGNYCTDTLRQTILLGHAQCEIPHDTTSCISPIRISAQSMGNGVEYHWSSNNLFSDTLNASMNHPFFETEIDSSCWYYIHVVDMYGCEETDSVHITFNNILDSIALKDIICPNYCNGEIALYPSSIATHPCHYQWDNGPWTNNSSNSDLCAGEHIVTIRDAHQCQNTHHVTITAPEFPQIQKNLTHVLCLEYCTGQANIIVTGTNAPYQIVWLANNDTNDTQQNLCPGTYYFQIIDKYNCVLLDSVTILENADFHISTQIEKISCTNECTGIASVIVEGGTQPYTYQWSSGNNTNQATNLCAGWEYVAVTDNSGCISHDSIYIDSKNSFTDIHTWADDDIIFEGETTNLHVTPVPGATYDWYPTQWLTQYNTPNPIATPIDTTMFYVTITDSLGCTYNDSIRLCCITVDCSRTNVKIPNIFTPNGDGKNDKLCITGEYITEFYIAIFTRWGELIYESYDINECWDGRYKDNWCMPGVYTYICKVTCESNKQSQFKGDITLIK